MSPITVEEFLQQHWKWATLRKTACWKFCQRPSSYTLTFKCCVVWPFHIDKKRVCSSSAGCSQACSNLMLCYVTACLLLPSFPCSPSNDIHSSLSLLYLQKIQYSRQLFVSIIFAAMLVKKKKNKVMSLTAAAVWENCHLIYCIILNYCFIFENIYIYVFYFGCKTEVRRVKKQNKTTKPIATRLLPKGPRDSSLCA